MSVTESTPALRNSPLRKFVRSTRSFLRSGWDFLLPPSCVFCGRETSADHAAPTLLCEECTQSLRPAPGPECAKCAAPVGPYLDTTHGCIHCHRDKFRFDRIIRLGVYRAELRRAVLQAKTDPGDWTARALADLLWRERTEDFAAGVWDVVVPIPAHWARRLTQRHHASETLAERLAERLRLPYDPGLLKKVRSTPAQAGSAPSVRRRQQRGAFRADVTADGLKILLVDDVLTTGATAQEACKVLKSRGAAAITVAVIARGLGESG